ncbi:MAG TPA: S8 family serine peptidase, partial [Phycisphaerae bacterium]|nr:S8 family serine peptidase [Phycisphaerae bacterium]
MLRWTIAISAIALSTGAALGTESSVPFINADDVHAQGITGRGVTVAVIDTGIDYAHPGLAGSITGGGLSRVDGQWVYDGGAALPGVNHGTRMSLIITDATGVAPNARILPVRVFGASAPPLPDDVWMAVLYVAFRRQTDPSVRVMNLGVGRELFPCSCDADDPNVAAAVSQAAAEGIVTFVPTGNEGYCGGMNTPACVSSAVRVTGSYDADYEHVYFPGVCDDPVTLPYRVACFSNIAEDCDYLLAAPGFGVTVGGFASSMGTSPATAHCSGVAALMFEKNRCGTLDAYSARSTIFNTATVHDWASPYCAMPPQPRHVNALAAVNAVPTGSCSPTLGDLDCDGTVGLSDFAVLLECLLGPGAGPAAGWCACADLVGGSRSDGDVDLEDFAAFQVAFSGDDTGACCHGDGTCTEGTVHECDAAGAYYQGHATTCATVECPLPNWGACCQAGGSCTEETVEDCIWGEGLYLGDGTLCASADCPTVAYQNFVLNPS